MSKKFVFDDVLDANVQKTKEAIANASQIIEVNSEAEWKAHPKYGDPKVIFWIKSGNYIADAAGVKYEDTNVAAELTSIKGNLTDLTNVDIYRADSSKEVENQSIATKNNNICYVSINIALTGNFASNEMLLYNFPIPYNALEVVLSSNTDNIRAKLQTDGKLYIDGTKSGLSRAWYSAMFSYPISR